MATLLLSALGASLGGTVGGGALGLTGAVLGRAAGAAVGRAIDQRLMGSGSAAVETGRVERFRLMGAGEGSAIPQVWGRYRLPGQVIWATRFREDRKRRGGGGKGGGGTTITEYSYSVSLALALCEGPILHVGRIWADGNEISPASLSIRVYTGDESQLPDPLIEAVEGAGKAGAYRGTAYVVIEDLPLGRFGNRVPQFSFEVVRNTADVLGQSTGLDSAVRAVALLPGTGEYTLATRKVRFDEAPGSARVANVHTPSGKTDLPTSLDQLQGELPRVEAVSLIVSWFGDDLRCGICRVRPKVEQTVEDASEMPWRSGGITRQEAMTVPQSAGRVVYGGTPADDAVVEAIATLRDRGQAVMFYPFLLMEQMPGNARPDPWTGAASQPTLPWRGRITLSVAPGRPGSPDGTSAAAAEVAAFFGSVAASDFAVVSGRLVYSGPADDWGYRRFILHYAHLCKLSGGVGAFCIGSEMRSLTQARGMGNSFPAVEALRALAADVRSILGPTTRIGYAADWSEYFGLHSGDDVYFHLDPLWADPAIDFVGIDNYMPVTDWRDTPGHADAGWRSIYNPDYIAAGFRGGEGYDWYYDSDEGAEAQRRLPIEDGAGGEPWVFRFKDLWNWWGREHHDRIGGVRQPAATAWVPASKPIWFTEYGCPAVDKGTNQPNRFVDPKSSESGVPRGSDGLRDDFIQMQYLRAFADFWTDPANNPVSPVYGGPMVDLSRAFAWAWDARPFPAFPNRADRWSDGENYRLGHWLNGRATGQPLAQVVEEICRTVDPRQLDCSALEGVVRGFGITSVSSARSQMQQLGMAFAFDAVEGPGSLRFRHRQATPDFEVQRESLALAEGLPGRAELTRTGEAEQAKGLLITHLEDQGSLEVTVSAASGLVGAVESVAETELGLVLLTSEAQVIAERWLAEMAVTRDRLRLALPLSASHLSAGDVLALDSDCFRIERVDRADRLIVEAVRVEQSAYARAGAEDNPRAYPAHVPAGPVYAQFLDLPLLVGDEVPHAPHLAIAADPWGGAVGLWSAIGENGFSLDTLVSSSAMIGTTETALPRAEPGLVDRGPRLRITAAGMELASADWLDVLAGGNMLAIGDGSADRWEVIQFAEAEPVGPMQWEIGRRLRGQFGTDGLMPDEWPAGSVVVVLDAALQQTAMPVHVRGLARTYRIGLASEGYGGPEVIERVEAFAGNGLRPYPVAHLRAVPEPDGGIRVTWIRRTRIDGDSWVSLEVPLGETSERYQVRVRSGAIILRDVNVTAPEWLYPAAAVASDAGLEDVSVEVAQISDSFGPGPWRSLPLFD